MRYVGRLVLAVQAAALAGWVHAGTVTVNGINCGSASGNVTISATGDISVTTNDQTSCAPGGGGNTGGPYTVTVSKGGSGTVGTVTAAPDSGGDGIDCGSDCSGAYAAGSSVTLNASDPAPGETFSWGGACSGSSTTCTLSNLSANKSVSVTYNAAGSTNCPTGVTCIERPWPTIAQEQFSMKANAVMAIKVNTTAQGATGFLNTMYTTGNTASRQVSISQTAGDFTGGGQTRCVTSGLEVTTTKWAQQTTDTRSCQLPANGTAWINVKFTNCAATSCTFYLKNN